MAARTGAVSGPPPDLEQLVQEALTQLGWDANAKHIAHRVWRLNIGLPREDEFSIVCTWLGRCALVHKLDQKQIPQKARDIYQVPDLLAIFMQDERRIPALVEVKSKNANTLSFRPDYYERLKRYADHVGLPLLIAWKFHGVWILFEVRHLAKARTNWNIRFDLALKESLLGVLTGDFSYSLRRGAGVHIRFRKDRLLKTTYEDQSYTEEWSMTCDDVYFTDGEGREIRDLPKEIQSLFFTWDLPEIEEHSDTHIKLSYVVSEETLLFAHMGLVSLLQFRLPAGENINWRKLLHESKIVENFEAAVANAVEWKIVRIVIRQRPQSQAAFLQER